jgi:hypothetical protein
MGKQRGSLSSFKPLPTSEPRCHVCSLCYRRERRGADAGASQRNRRDFFLASKAMGA